MLTLIMVCVGTPVHAQNSVSDTLKTELRHGWSFGEKKGTYDSYMMCTDRAEGELADYEGSAWRVNPDNTKTPNGPIVWVEKGYPEECNCDPVAEAEAAEDYARALRKLTNRFTRLENEPCGDLTTKGVPEFGDVDSLTQDTPKEVVREYIYILYPYLAAQPQPMTQTQPAKVEVDVDVENGCCCNDEPEVKELKEKRNFFSASATALNRGGFTVMGGLRTEEHYISSGFYLGGGFQQTSEEDLLLETSRMDYLITASADGLTDIFNFGKRNQMALLVGGEGFISAGFFNSKTRTTEIYRKIESGELPMDQFGNRPEFDRLTIGEVPHIAYDHGSLPVDLLALGKLGWQFGTGKAFNLAGGFYTPNLLESERTIYGAGGAELLINSFKMQFVYNTAKTFQFNISATL